MVCDEMSRRVEKMDVTCPECGEKNEVLWFPWDYYSYRTQGSAGLSSTRSHQRQEKVEGRCKGCNYKFKPDDV